MSLRDHYDRHILPHLIDWVMRSPMATREREELIPQAQGRVLEIGAGSGLNFPYYGGAIDHLYALEPSRHLIRKAAPRAARTPFPVEFLNLKGEAIPLPDASIDTVVSTWVLCSILGIEAALAELRRVLKPGGVLLFIEHGLAPTPALAAWQDRLTPMWACCAGGCQLNRRPDRLIEAAGFHLERLEQSFLDGPKLLTYHYKGLARRT
jgi:ubiquinone/menaquinone biosynthesis C-methylase UbiE